MSFQTQSGDINKIEEVLPAAMKTGLTSSSLLLQRKTVRVAPQGAQTLGTPSSGSGAGNQNLSFLLSGNGGLIDLKSARLNYYVQVSGTGANVSVDDGHPLSIFNVALGGQNVESITNACRLTNMEMTLGGSKSYLQTAGSFQGFQLLSDDLITGTSGQYGAVLANMVDAKTRQTRSATPQTGGVIGQSVSIPLSCISGFFRCNQYLPDMLGDLTIQAQTLSAAEYVFNGTASVTGDYSLDRVNITYDVVFPDPRYTAVLRKAMTDPNDALLIAYESAIVSTGAQVAASNSALQENTIIVSRATSMLTRAAIAFVAAGGLSTPVWPSQSCFAHAGIYSAQVRVASSVYPNFPAQGDADLFNMSLSAYGSPSNENGTVTNRALWANSTRFVSAGGAASIFENANTVATGGSTTAGDIKFAYGDRCVIAYGFRSAKNSEPVDLDGVSLAQALTNIPICVY